MPPKKGKAKAAVESNSSGEEEIIEKIKKPSLKPQTQKVDGSNGSSSTTGPQKVGKVFLDSDEELSDVEISEPKPKPSFRTHGSRMPAKKEPKQEEPNRRTEAEPKHPLTLEFEDLYKRHIELTKQKKEATDKIEKTSDHRKIKKDLAEQKLKIFKHMEDNSLDSLDGRPKKYFKPLLLKKIDLKEKQKDKIVDVLLKELPEEEPDKLEGIATLCLE